jgi:Zn-dependent peptidase ImmA (M78 family)
LEFLPKFKTFNSKNHKEIIRYIIEVIYPNLDKIQSLKTAKGLYEYLISKIEKLNILIFRISNTESNLRGLAIYNDILPIIAINSSDSDTAKVFTLIHELAHILLQTSMIHNNATINRPHSDIEKLCNSIAGKVLFQHDNIYNDKDITQLLKKPLIQLGDIKQIAEKYCISRDVVIRRMFDSKIIDNNSYDRLNSDLKESRNSEVRTKTTGGGKDTHLYTTINRLGMQYCKAIYQGYSSGYIQRYDLHHYLKRKDQYCVQILDAVSKRLKK